MSLNIPIESLGTIINNDLDVYKSIDLINGEGNLYIRDGGIYKNIFIVCSFCSISTCVLNLNYLLFKT